MKATDVMEVVFPFLSIHLFIYFYFLGKLPNFPVLLLCNYEIDTENRTNDSTWKMMYYDINGILTLMRSILIISNRSDIDYGWMRRRHNLLYFQDVLSELLWFSSSSAFAHFLNKNI